MYKYKFLQVGQLPWEHLSFLQNPLNFFITKYLKHEVDGNLSIWVDKHSSCDLYNRSYKDLSHDLYHKIYVTWSKGSGVAIPNGEVLYQLLSQSCFTAQIW